MTGKVDERIHLFAAAQAKRRPSRQEERSVGSDARRDLAKQRERRAAPEPPEHLQRRRRVGAAAAEPGLHRNRLLDCHDRIGRIAGPAQRFPERGRSPPDQVPIVERHTGRPALEHERTGFFLRCHRVVQRNRLKHRAELVVAVGARAKHPQIQVDLGVRARGHAPLTGRRGLASG